MAGTKTFVGEWRGFGSSTALAAVVIAVLGSAIDKQPLVSILGAVLVWTIVNALYVLFYQTFLKSK